MYKFKLYQRKKKGSYLKQTIYCTKDEYNTTVCIIERLIEIGYIAYSNNYSVEKIDYKQTEMYLETIDKSSSIFA